MKLTLRDFFWIVFVAALLTMWWIDRSRLIDFYGAIARHELEVLGRKAMQPAKPAVPLPAPPVPSSPPDPSSPADPFAKPPDFDPFADPVPPLRPQKFK